MTPTDSRKAVIAGAGVPGFRLVAGLWPYGPDDVSTFRCAEYNLPGPGTVERWYRGYRDA